MELISREEALKQIEEAFDMGDCNCDRFALRGILKNLPTIEERKEGHWIKLGKCEYKCPICGKKIFADDVNERNYCPSCGMKAK